MLNSRLRYLQISLNSSPGEAQAIVAQLPKNERILVEVGTPLIKSYGAEAIRTIKRWWGGYVVADLKTMDRAETEVNLAASGGADGVIALGEAPIETLNAFIQRCEETHLDSVIDMMNVDQPVKVMRKLKKIPKVVLLHRGVDEEKYNKDIPIPYIGINKVKSTYNCLIGIGGGDTIREVQRAIFNGANIVMVWKEFFRISSETAQLAQEFLTATK